MLRTFALSAALLLAVPSAGALDDVKAPGPDWVEANRKSDLVIFTRDDKNAGVREIFVASDMNFPPRAVFDVVADTENYPEFMPYVKQTRTVEKLSADEAVVWTLLSPPLVSDRDYVIRLKRTTGSAANGGVFKTEWTSAWQKVPETKGVVRVKINEGTWKMQPLDGGRRTRLTYQLLTHPGGSIPSWVANKSNTVALPDLFKAIRERAARQSAVSSK